MLFGRFDDTNMKFEIDNFDGTGAVDYTPAVDAARLPQVVRRLNKAAELRVGLVATRTGSVVPVAGARVTLAKSDGQLAFTGYISGPPALEYAGLGEGGTLYRYSVIAFGDESILDRKRLPNRAAFVARGAGDALRQICSDLLPGVFDTSAVQELDALPSYSPDPQKKFSAHAGEIAVRARAAFRTENGALKFAPVGVTVHALDEASEEFSPEGLKLDPTDAVINDVTVLGQVEAQDFVHDYFVGDGSSLRFYLSQIPFTRSSRTLLDEEYLGTALDSTRWGAVDPVAAVTVGGGKLQVAGGTGADGATTVVFAEKIELGGAFVLQHGDVAFSGSSNGVLGGLYQSGISVAGCLAGFRVTPSGSQSHLQALINGALIGPVVTTIAGHHYVLTTRFYTNQIYRLQQTFHSAARPAGSGRGGGGLAADVRLVLEVHDIDPANPASMVAPSTVLFDGIINGAPGFCKYALVNAASMQASIAFTRLLQAAVAEVRSALPGASYRTRLTGSLAEGAECTISSSPAVQFYPAYAPAENELIQVRYRGLGRALARVTNPTSVAALAHGSDDGVRGAVRIIQSPPARTTADCENAALAILDDTAGAAWAGDYQTWSDFWPGGQDVFPGDAVQVNAPSRGAVFSAIVREVAIQVKDLDGEHSSYSVKFSDDAAQPLAYEVTSASHPGSLNVVAVEASLVGTTFIADLTAVSISLVTSTTVTLDAGVTPPAGGGFEVRRTDFGWGPLNDRNLIGRFSTQSFLVPRLARTQDYYLRQYDASTTPKYSRYTAAIHIDYPL